MERILWYLINPIVLYNELIELKEIAKIYKEKSPDSIILFKTMNYVRGNFKKMSTVVSDFTAIRQVELAYKVFGQNNFTDKKHTVYVLDTYRMTEPVFDLFNYGNIHPGRRTGKKFLLYEIGRYLLDYYYYIKK